MRTGPLGAAPVQNCNPNLGLGAQTPLCCRASVPATAASPPGPPAGAHQPAPGGGGGEPSLAWEGYETRGRGGGQQSLKKSPRHPPAPPVPAGRAASSPAALQAQIAPLPPSARQPAADGRCGEQSSRYCWKTGFLAAFLCFVTPPLASSSRCPGRGADSGDAARLRPPRIGVVLVPSLKTGTAERDPPAVLSRVLAPPKRALAPKSQGRGGLGSATAWSCSRDASLWGFRHPGGCGRSVPWASALPK